MNIFKIKRYAFYFLTVVLVGCASSWKAKYGEPTPVNLDGVDIAVYVKPTLNDSYDVLSLNDTGIRLIQPLDDARRYKLAAEIVMTKRCGGNSMAKILLETNEEGIAGRFFEYACVRDANPNTK